MTGGATNADWGGSYIYNYYYFWDGSKSVRYGNWWYDGYWDSMVTWTSFCDYWSDEATGQQYGPYALTYPEACAPETTIASGPSRTTSSTSATFEFTANQLSTFECSLDSGAFASCNSPASYTGLRDGSHTFRVRATDPAGNTDPTPAEHTWTVDTTAPVANFTYSCSALMCTFDATGSTGAIQTYSWDFGDGDRASGTTAQHGFAQARTYTVKLTVTDDRGAAASDSKSITVEAPPPPPPNASPVASFTYTCPASGLTCSFDGSQSSDSDGAIVAYQWDFGDSTGASLSDATVEHTFREAGTYEVKLKVVDNGNATGTSAAKPVTVRNAAPIASFTSSCSALSCAFDGSASTDSDGAIRFYGWDFGDGTTSAGSLVAHTYSLAGSYTAKLTVIDDGGINSSVSRTVTVAATGGGSTPNAAPTARFSSSCDGLRCKLDATGSADSDGTITSYAWAFGDGTPNGAGIAAEHVYGQPGSYTVKLTVTDDDGASDTVSHAITLIYLTARGYKIKGLQNVDLSWNGAAGASYDVYRNDSGIATVAASSYTDDLSRKGSGSYSYKVCQAGGSICSNQATVSF